MRMIIRFILNRNRIFSGLYFANIIVYRQKKENANIFKEEFIVRFQLAEDFVLDNHFKSVDYVQN